MKSTALLFALLVLAIPAVAQQTKPGSGTVRVSHLSLDEEGSRSVSYRVFNVYEGTALSMEDWTYDLGNGTRARFNGRNLTLNNRWMEGSLVRPASFGLTLTNSQNRRIYSFDGTEFLRRHSSSANGHFYILPSLRFDLGGNLQGQSGTPEPLFNLTDIPLLRPIDLEQQTGRVALRYADNGRTLGVELRGTNYDDKLDDHRDQSRRVVRVDAAAPLPKLDWISVSGGYRYFSSKPDNADTDFVAHTAWAGGTAAFDQHWSLKYAFVFDRAGYSTDLVETDNLTNAAYLTYRKDKTFLATAGYQYGINDDYGNEVRSNNFYGSIYFKGISHVELKADVGTRAEELNDGARLLGDENWNRYRGSIRYRFSKTSYARLVGENVRRENDLIGSKVDSRRATVDASITLADWTLSGSAGYSEGEYTNTEGLFLYVDRVASGDLLLPRWNGIQLGARSTYYRASGELFIESFQNTVTADIDLSSGYSLRGSYTADNYDNLQILSQFYTGNIIEVSIAKALSF